MAKVNDDSVLISGPFSTEMIRVLLRLGVLELTFSKVNGDDRFMECTLNRHFLPGKDETRMPTRKFSSPDTIVVWDIEKNDWRSLNVDAIRFNYIRFHTIDETVDEPRKRVQITFTLEGNADEVDDLDFPDFEDLKIRFEEVMDDAGWHLDVGYEDLDWQYDVSSIVVTKLD